VFWRKKNFFPLPGGDNNNEGDNNDEDNNNNNNNKRNNIVCVFMLYVSRWPCKFLSVGQPTFQLLGLGYTRDCLPADSFALRARAMVLTGERTLSDTSGARQ
jgi:hypothetical protein